MRVGLRYGLIARYSGTLAAPMIGDQPLAFELRVGVVALDGQPRRRAGRLGGVGQHLAVTNRPLRDVDASSARTGLRRP